ncbi:hypothetical protein EDB89DRAFT_2110907 [Lactarius sanguifluus]|nr:hypothetical protein EDB89DRAFT_2110907 [Lactarius sanguifluus]
MDGCQFPHYFHIVPDRSGIETTTTPTKSPRKVPRCTKCQRPRAGHPRQGCPYTNSPRHAVQQDLSASMDSLTISPRKTQLNARRRLPAHDITLASLSTEPDNILNRLIQPEDTYEDFSLADGDVGTGPTPELPSAPSRPPFQEGRTMPGTLITPAPSFLTETALLRETPQPSCHFDSKASIAMPPPKSTPPPLARSMSVEERTAFLDGLSELSRGPPATVYSIHVLELQHMVESATKLGFHTGVVLPKTGPREEGLLILGRDPRAVEDLAARLSQEGPKQSGVRAIAGGVVAGAVATFTGLALA